MKTIIFLLLTFLLFATIASAGDVRVNGYFRSDGTYVPGYSRLLLININGIIMERSHKTIIPITLHIHLTIGIMIEMAS